MLALKQSDVAESGVSARDDAWCRRLGNFPPPAQSNTRVFAANFDSFFDAPILASRGAMRRTVRPRWASQLLLMIFGLMIAAALFEPCAALAQSMPGGGMGGHGGRGGHNNDSDRNTSANKSDATPAHRPNPLRAMLAEMPKLRADLLLTSVQIGPWSAMEDALRDSVELNRSRVPVASDTNANGPDAELFVQDLADNQRALADALTRLTTTMKTAFATLNPRQLKLSRDRLAAALDAEIPQGASQNP